MEKGRKFLVKANRWIAPVFALVLAAVLIWGLGLLVRPKYASGITLEGSMVQNWYDHAGEGHQVLFVGDCEVYESFSPVTLFNEFGATSYIRGSAQQLMWQSYYLLREALTAVKQEIAELGEATQTERKSIHRKTELEQQIPQKESALQQLQTELGEIDRNRSGLQAELQTKTERMTIDRKTLRFDGRAGAERRIRELGAKGVQALGELFQFQNHKNLMFVYTLDYVILWQRR